MFLAYLRRLETADNISLDQYFDIFLNVDKTFTISFAHDVTKISMTGNLFNAFGSGNTIEKEENQQEVKLNQNVFMSKYFKLVCNKINGGLSTFKNGQVQFDSNILTVLHPCCLEYQNKTLDTHSVINSNGPIEIKLTDDCDRTIQYQFIIQTKFYQSTYFINEVLDVNPVEEKRLIHQKQQMYLYTEDIVNDFTFLQRPKEMAISQLNGFIQLDDYDPENIITGYIYKINFNNQFREYATATQYTISSLNNNVFTFIETNQSNTFKIKIRTFQIQYINGLRTVVEIFDHSPKILYRLLVKL
ncbi:Hypothetical_protein [Hexamita inflata]|uniref:Hypothetical_protein n=1 Tax=Hexamita inflata TaxID=28002 RepID=A0ABP1GZI8_9EUKA